MSEHEGPAASFLSIFLGFRQRLARAIARIVRPDDIDDIVQEGRATATPPRQQSQR